jgi:hypothetical protein
VNHLVTKNAIVVFAAVTAKRLQILSY